MGWIELPTRYSVSRNRLPLTHASFVLTRFSVFLKEGDWVEALGVIPKTRQCTGVVI